MPRRAHGGAGAAGAHEEPRQPATIRCSKSGCARCCRSAPRRASRSSPTWARPIRKPPRGRPPRSRRSLGLSSLKIAAIVGDDVLDACKAGDFPIMEFDGTIKQLGNRLLSANAYLGAEPMAEALQGGADVVITGRASDPALFLAPMIHAFGWAMDDWNLLGQGTVAGHLAGMRRPDHRRLFRRSRLQGHPRSGAARLSDRRSRRGRLARRHQGRGLGRRGDRADLQGATALRGPRSPAISPARRGRGFLASERRGDRTGSCARQRRAAARSGPAR